MSLRSRDILISVTVLREAQSPTLLRNLKNISSVGLDLFFDDAQSSKQHRN